MAINDERDATSPKAGNERSKSIGRCIRCTDNRPKPLVDGTFCQGCSDYIAKQPD